MDEQATAMLQLEYQSNLIQSIRNNGYTLQQGDVTIHLAQAMGFCWGVERAIALAYETRQQFPFERIWITNEIIHNPLVNQNMQDMGVKFIPVNQQGQKDFSVVNKEDVVILPAFGASFEEMQLLKEKGWKVMDTTIPWVSKVWNNVEKHKQRNYTSLVHGKYKHEETIATTSFAGKYLVILNLQQAEYVCNYIRKAHEYKEEFWEIYENSETVDSGKERFTKWLGKASLVYGQVITTITNHLDSICNYFLSRASSEFLEGINNKIKQIKRQAYGFTNFENFRIRLLACFAD